MKQNYFGIQLFLIVFILSLSTSGALFGQSVFINEIHYDNAGTDTGEAVEVAGPAGTDLTGWSIVLYNGGNGAVYNTSALSGLIPDLTNGYGVVVVSYPSNGIQNGSPDALALVDVSNTVVQFLSYEGSFAAVDGPATGMTSTDIGVSENGSEDGMSLQLAGTGLLYTDFTWQTPGTSTIGSVNNGQIFSGTVVIDTEAPSVPANLIASNITQTTVDLSWDAATDNIGVTSYQIFEGIIQLATTSATNYSVTGLTANTAYSFTVKAADASGNVSPASDAVDITTLENTTPPITEGTVFMNEIHYDNTGADIDEGVEIAGPAGTDVTGWSIVAYNGNGGASYSTTSLTGLIPDQVNGYGTMAVSISGLQNGAPDGLALVDNNNVVLQFLSYEGSFTATNGPALGMVSTDIGVSETSAEAVGSSLQLTGKGTLYADFSWQGAAPNTFGAINTGQKFGDLVFINEIHYDNASTDTDEAVEVAGWAGTDLTGWSIELYNGNGGGSYGSISLSGIIPDQVNGYGTLYFLKGGLQNGSPDGLALVDGHGTVIQFLSYEGTFTATDGPALGMESSDIGIEETGSTPVGYSLQLTGTGAVYADFNWVAAANTFGAVNTGQTFQDSGTTPPEIELISISQARALADGTTAKITGVLTVSDQFAGSAYIQDTTGAIAVFDPLVHGDGVFMVGDSITITGTRSTYNGQIQISPVTSVESNGVASQSIVPLTITLSELGNHPAELVRIADPIFPKPGDILFGNANYVLTDASGTGELRIDNDVEEIVGLGQPETCSEIIGVVGRYNDLFQLLPRFGADMACAGPYEPSGNDLAAPKDKTLDIATWNLAWFGDEANSPAAGNPDSDHIQKDAVKNVLQQLDADIYGVEEVSDDALFAQMVSEMPGYAYVLSEATSYPNDEGVKQKIGFIYNTNTVEVVSTKVLLASIHPYYNGGDDSALSDFPDPDKTRFYASGRLPFMLTANVTIDGVTQQVNVIDLHARANTGDNLEKYNMRKYDVEVLKDSLDTYYPNANLVMVGDYNDDVDFTVSDVYPITDSSFKAYVDDTADYNVLTSILSDEGYRSYVTYENMIDHIMVSNELEDKYINESARVHYEFYNSSYTHTTSDHFPVSVRLQLKLLTLDSSASTDATCNNSADGTASVTVSGGITPYTYEWSDGQSTPVATGLAAGTYSVTVTDVLGAMVSTTVTIGEPDILEITASEDTTVYVGYPPASCATLEVMNTAGGTAPYTFEWGTGATTDTIEVCPEETTVYTVTVTDANGCTATAMVNVTAVNVACGTNGKNPKVEICHNGNTICVAQSAIEAHLNHGDSLGSCDSAGNAVVTDLMTYPNPFADFVTVTLNTNIDSNVDLLIFDLYGQLVNQSKLEVANGSSEIQLQLTNIPSGFYYLKAIVNGQVLMIKNLVKE